MVLPDAPPLLDVQLPSQAPSSQEDIGSVQDVDAEIQTPSNAREQSLSSGSGAEEIVSDYETATPKARQFPLKQPTAPVDDTDLDELIKVPDFSNEKTPLTPDQEKERKREELLEKFENQEIKVSSEEPPTGADILTSGWKAEKEKQSASTSADEIQLTEDDIELSGEPPKNRQAELDYVDETKGSKSNDRQFRFDCLICGSLIYSSESKIGTDLLCPECDSVMTIPVPHSKMFVAVNEQVIDPLATDEEIELKLSDPVELPTLNLDLNQEEIAVGDDDVEIPPFNSEQLESLKSEITDELRKELKPDVSSDSGTNPNSESPEIAAPSPSQPKNVRPASTAPTLEDPELDYLAPTSAKPSKSEAKSTASGQAASGQAASAVGASTAPAKASPATGQTSNPTDELKVSDPIPVRTTDKAKSKSDFEQFRPKNPKIEPEPEFEKPEIDENKWFAEMMVFFKSLHVIMRLFAAAGLIAVTIYLAYLSNYWLNDENRLWNMIGYFLYLPTLLFTFFTAVFVANVGSSIIESTSIGKRMVEQWTEFGIGEWLSRASYFISAFVIGAFPGIILSLVSGSLLMIVAIASITLTLMFPILLVSTMENQSPFQPLSGKITSTFNSASNLWKSFYLQSFGCLVVASPFIIICIVFPEFLAHLIAGVGIAFVVFAYFRFLGYHAFRLNEHFKAEERLKTQGENSK